MVQEETTPIGDIPEISFTDEEIANIRANLDLPPDEVSDEPIVQPPIRRKRGRPRKYPRPEDQSTETTSKPGFSPAPLTKRDEREVSTRLEQILQGATGIAANAKPYLQMTEEEAKAIADPLSSYLVRNADTIPVARQVLENYDLLAIVLGVFAYVVRVYHDRSEELAKQSEQASGPGSKTISRLEQLRETPQNGREVRQGDFISAPYGPGDGLSPTSG